MKHRELSWCVLTPEMRDTRVALESIAYIVARLSTTTGRLWSSSTKYPSAGIQIKTCLPYLDMNTTANPANANKMMSRSECFLFQSLALSSGTPFWPPRSVYLCPSPPNKRRREAFIRFVQKTEEVAMTRGPCWNYNLKRFEGVKKVADDEQEA